MQHFKKIVHTLAAHQSASGLWPRESTDQPQIVRSRGDESAVLSREDASAEVSLDSYRGQGFAASDIWFSRGVIRLTVF